MFENSSKFARQDAHTAEWVLGLIFACLAAGIVGTGYFYYRNYEKIYRAAVERQLTSIADLKVSDLVQWRNERLGDGSIFFQNASFTALVRRFLEKPEDLDSKQQLQVWLSKCQAHNWYDQTRLLDAQGVTRLSLPAALPAVSTSVARSVSEGTRLGRVTLHDLYRSEQDQQIYMGVLVPIFDEQNANRLLGTIFLRIDPSTYLYPMIQRWPTPSSTAETLIVRREGNEVVFLNNLRFQRNTALTLRESLDGTLLPAAQAALGKEGIMEGIDYRGVPVVAALRTIPDSPWSLVARIDASEVYAPLHSQLRIIVGLFSALLFGAGAGVGFIWRGQRALLSRTEHSLESNRGKLVAIIESSDNAIYSKTIDGALITSWNEGAERLFGYKAAEMIGQSGVSIIPQAFLAEENEFRGRVGKGEHIRSHETVRIAKGGRPIAVSMTVSPIRDSAGRIIEESAIVSDITERRRAEESRSRLAAIIESSDDAIISKKLDGTITSWNAGAEKLFGYQVAEMIGQPITRIIPPELQADEKEILDRLKNGGRIRSYETVRIAKDGRRVNTSLTISPIFDGEGKIIGASKICRDISERKRDEVALRESEKRFSEMFNSSPVATSLSTVREGRYLDVNDAWAKMYERPRDDVVGRTVFDLNIWVDLDRRAALFAKLQERGIVRDFEMELRSKSGRVVQISWSGTKVVIGGESCLLGSALDITERKLAEEMLRASEAKFRTLVENIPQKILMKDRNCRWISISKNLARDFGFRPEDVVGKTDSQLFTPELAAKYHADDVRIMETGHVEELEEKYLAEGKETWVNTIKTPVRNANGEIVGVLGIFWDITERKQAQEALRTLNAELEQRVRDRTTALEASNKELEAFSYSVSHDLRAPLRAMDGFSMALLDDNAGKLDETAQGYLRRIRAGSQRMATLIDDLLNLSRVTRAKLLRESVDLTAMAEEIGGEFQKSQPERQVALIVAPGLAVYADRSTLRVVLNNLLGNAWKFTGRCAQARIEVGAQERDGQRIFFVRDNGAGFDMAYVDKLFGAFQRLHSTQEFEGTGIGLALVQRIINRHGGRAWAEGAVGRGATVYFTLEEKGTDS